MTVMARRIIIFLLPQAAAAGSDPGYVGSKRRARDATVSFTIATCAVRGDSPCGRPRTRATWRAW